MTHFGEAPKTLDFDIDEEEEETVPSADPVVQDHQPQVSKPIIPPKQDEFLWQWKVRHFRFFYDLSLSNRLPARVGDDKTYIFLVVESYI